MLASKISNIEKLRYPFLVSNKLDGIRATVQGGKLVSRHLKMIRNEYVQQVFGRPELEGLDGELIMGPPNAHDVFRKTSSAVMSQYGKPDVVFNVFDCLSSDTFDLRFKIAELIVGRGKGLVPSGAITIIDHRICDNHDQLMELEEEVLTDGFEGLMLRDPYGPYKHGRSTENQGWLLKLKRFEDAEAEVIAFEEKMHNDNEGIRDINTGKLNRSSHKENMIPTNTLGALVVKDLKTGIIFNVGTGFDDNERAQIWLDWDKYRGQIIKYKHFPIGVKIKPRMPKFEGFRDMEDL